jgi:hypothetical protein
MNRQLGFFQAAAFKDTAFRKGLALQTVKAGSA